MDLNGTQRSTYIRLVHAACGVLTAVAFNAPCCAQSSPTLDKIRHSATLTLAHGVTSVPFSYVDERGQALGYAVDLCRRIADAVKSELKLASLNIKYVPAIGKDRIDAIVDGRADLECGSTSNNAERRQKVAFTIPHYVAGTRLLVSNGSSIRGAGDLRGKTVAVTKGSTAHRIIDLLNQNRALGVQVLYAGTSQQAFNLVAERKADAFANDDVILYGLRANSGRADAFEIVGDLMSVEPLAIMLRKDDPVFKQLVNREMSRLIAKSEIQQLYRRWFQDPIPPKNTALGMPMNFLTRDSFRFPSDRVDERDTITTVTEAAFTVGTQAGR